MFVVHILTLSFLSAWAYMGFIYAPLFPRQCKHGISGLLLSANGITKKREFHLRKTLKVFMTLEVKHEGIKLSARSGTLHDARFHSCLAPNM